MLIYASSPVSVLVGYGTIFDCVRAKPSELWKRYADHGGIEEHAGRRTDPPLPGAMEAEKAAEDWLSKNPPNPGIFVIRLWGVIVAYRRRGRRGRWSKALVRHGADPRSAVAVLLGVRAENVLVGGCAQ